IERGEKRRSKAGRVAGVLRYPISATAVEKPLPHKGPESFPSWTSPVRPRSPALVVHRTPPALGLHPPLQNGSDTDAAAFTRQPTLAGLPRSGRDAAARRRPSTAWPD